jgi:hypothetical protein
MLVGGAARILMAPKFQDLSKSPTDNIEGELEYFPQTLSTCILTQTTTISTLTSKKIS